MPLSYYGVPLKLCLRVTGGRCAKRMEQRGRTCSLSRVVGHTISSTGSPLRERSAMR